MVNLSVLAILYMSGLKNVLSALLHASGHPQLGLYSIVVSVAILTGHIPNVVAQKLV